MISFGSKYVVHQALHIMESVFRQNTVFTQGLKPDVQSLIRHEGGVAMKILGVVIGIILMAGVASVKVGATSLWDENNGNLYMDIKARYVGDVVTILVNESTSATQRSNTDLSQAETLNSGTGTGIVGKFLEAFGIEASDAYKTDGRTRSSGLLTTTVSAEVVEVLPNGNLVIEARRSLVVNNETQTMVLSGVIRPRDITRNNIIPSTKIANAQIRYEGKGPIARRQKPGILNKIFDWIF